MCKIGIIKKIDELRNSFRGFGFYTCFMIYKYKSSAWGYSK